MIGAGALASVAGCAHWRLRRTAAIGLGRASIDEDGHAGFLGEGRFGSAASAWAARPLSGEFNQLGN